MAIHAYTRDEPKTMPSQQSKVGFSLFWGTILAVAVLLSGIIPSPIFNLALKAAGSILH